VMLLTSLIVMTFLRSVDLPLANAVGSDGRLQRRERHSQHHGKRRPCGCAAVGLSHRAIPR